MKKIYFLVFVTTLSLGVVAQDPHFSQFFASPLTLNPAFTGKFNGAWRLALNHRDQWPNIPKAYVTSSASLDFGIMRDKLPNGDVWGFGVSGLTDASANSQLKLNYGSLSMSYHKALDEDGYTTIGAGFQATYNSMNLDVTKLTFEDMLRQNGFTGTTNDIITNGNNRSYFDVNAGILFSGSTNGLNNFYLGASMYHINRPKVNYKDKSWYLTGRITVHGGGTLPINDAFALNVSAIHQMQNKASETLVGAALEFNANGDRDAESPTNVYLGSWIRLNDAVIPYLGLEFKNLRIGASYDVNISSLKAATASRGGTEFSLIYTHQKQERGSGIPCPKF